ncbi:hypothetical protein Smp_183560 [Schistosoma mansoni]|uniref:hypothetical protein n=1 Tax=Schistosoma mansoni TaxID=6183 RepID=UPI00022C8213|nr:hypothetical protein Smp_183560 [Schistosoma mansoni]|eukprot:XP_018646743.1 hypothetical protein Smp_183560 [Schistosoma mansoni]
MMLICDECTNLWLFVCLGVFSLLLYRHIDRRLGLKTSSGLAHRTKLGGQNLATSLAPPPPQAQH